MTFSICSNHQSVSCRMSSGYLHDKTDGNKRKCFLQLQGRGKNYEVIYWFCCCVGTFFTWLKWTWQSLLLDWAQALRMLIQSISKTTGIHPVAVGVTDLLQVKAVHEWWHTGPGQHHRNLCLCLSWALLQEFQDFQTKSSSKSQYTCYEHFSPKKVTLRSLAWPTG